MHLAPPPPFRQLITRPGGGPSLGFGSGFLLGSESTEFRFGLRSRFSFFFFASQLFCACVYVLQAEPTFLMASKEILILV